VKDIATLPAKVGCERAIPGAILVNDERSRSLKQAAAVLKPEPPHARRGSGGRRLFTIGDVVAVSTATATGVGSKGR
jgi:hypothetical protein